MSNENIILNIKDLQRFTKKTLEGLKYEVPSVKYYLHMQNSNYLQYKYIRTPILLSKKKTSSLFNFEYI